MSIRRKTRIMITSGGGPGVWGLLHALRHLPGRDTTLLVQDCDAEPTLGTALADVAANLPPAGDIAYPQRLLDFCREHRVDALVPVFDGELLDVARRRDGFENGGTRVVLPPTPVVELAVDKWGTHQRLKGTIFVPDHMLVETLAEAADAIEALGYPTRKLCARPVNLSGGRGVHIIEAAASRFEESMLAKPGFPRCTASQFLDIRGEGPQHFKLIISEYLPGDDLGIDLLAHDGEVVEMVIRRKRGPMFHGNPMRMEFRELPGEREWVAQLAATLHLSGLLNIDAKYDETGKLRLLEINARPSACIGMSCGVVNLAAWAIDLALQDRIVDRAEYYAAEPATRSMRTLADMLIGPFGAEITAIRTRYAAASEIPTHVHMS